MAPSPPASSTSFHTLHSPPSNSRRRQRVSAEHTLERVRENQRRHRARRRDHIASLEQKLAETERLLAEARTQIAVLQAERDTANAFICYDLSKHLDVDVGIGEAVRNACTRAHVGDIQDGSRGSGDASRIMDVKEAARQQQQQQPSIDVTTIGSIPFVTLETIGSSAPSPPPSVPLALGPPPCCTDTPPLSANPVGSECKSCSTRPPPAPSESTTLCAQAFAMISQVNFRNVDAAQVRTWLAQGYRRPGKEGEGCSVENSVLWGVLDYISGM